MRLAFGLLLSTLLNDKLIQSQLLSGTLKHTLLNATFRHKAENVYLFRLSDSVCTVHSLQVSLWIPVSKVRSALIVD